MSIIISEDKNEIRRYLLGQLGEADEERMELRLLTDSSFVEEFDTIVDEIADQYVEGEFKGEELKRVEQHFLSSAERQQKVQFARELMQRAKNERSTSRDAVEVVAYPNFMQSVLEYWRWPSFSIQTVAIGMAAIVVIVGLAFVTRSIFFRPSGPDALITLNINTSDRASGSDRESVKIEPGTGRLRIELKLPDQTPQAQNYRVELLEGQRSRNLVVEERTPQSLIVAIPANEITPGSYIIHLHAVGTDGSEQRVRGNYVFNVL